MTLAPRAVVVTRRTEYEELLDRHGTAGAAAFFLRTRGRDLAELEARHERQRAALAAVLSAVPLEWRQGRLERAELPRFLFAPEDVVVVVGQDGLVANAAQHLDGQVVVGIDPEPGVNPGVLVRHRPDRARALLTRAVRPDADVEERTMVVARADDGQELHALNEVYAGSRTHQTARYALTAPDGRRERQASSGVLAGTGTGATGWCASVAASRVAPPVLPAPTERRLAWFVREAWPSPVTGTELVEGSVEDAPLVLDAGGDLVVFGDGLEAEALTLSYGQRLEIGLSPRRLRLLR